MIVSIAWKNIWRNPTRSLVLITATAIGVWSLVFLLGWVFGIVNSFISRSIDYRLGHIQVHHPDFGEEFNVQKSFELDQVAFTSHDPNLITGQRLVVQAMVSSIGGTGGVIIKGIDADEEKQLTKIHSAIKAGSYFSKNKNEILISTRLADKNGLEVGDKLIAQFQDSEKQLTSAAFRVKGIFDTGDMKLDALTAFVKISDVRRLIHLPENEIHEWLIKLRDPEQLSVHADNLKSKLPDLLVQTYGEISPDIRLFSTQIKLNVVIMTAIFMLALVFGIINTMLMAVLERVREIGMLMAIGMARAQIYRMIVWETFLLTMTGVPVGILLGWFTVYRLGINGINLSNWSEGLRQFGFPHIVKPELDFMYYVWVAGAVGLTAILAALYPSYKAIKLEPVEALRKL